jgi:hypothetical protein
MLSLTDRCDFCNNFEPAWEYPCKDFITLSRSLDDPGTLIGPEVEDMPDTPRKPLSESRGEWLACGACHDLIEANKLAELAKRCADADPWPDHAYAEHVLMLVALHGAFVEHRTGPARHLVH